MATLNYGTKELTCKIVYVGPGFGGKTTNLQRIHLHAPAGTTGDMTSLATSEDRTLFFDLLPLDLGRIGDFRVRVQLYTVPGQVKYNATRRLVLKGADGIVIVFDSDPEREEANTISLANLGENLLSYGQSPQDVPTVFQYNKRDLPCAMDLRRMREALNPGEEYPEFESIATEGVGVMETIRRISSMVFHGLEKGMPSRDSEEPGLKAPIGERSIPRDLPADEETLPFPGIEAEPANGDAAPAEARLGLRRRIKQLSDIRMRGRRVGYALIDLVAEGEGGMLTASVQLNPVLGAPRTETVRFAPSSGPPAQVGQIFEATDGGSGGARRLHLVTPEEGPIELYLSWATRLGEVTILPEGRTRPPR